MVRFEDRCMYNSSLTGIISCFKSGDALQDERHLGVLIEMGRLR